MNCRIIPVYGDERNVRDWIYVEDHCDAISCVLNNGKLEEIYNIGGHCEKENIQIVKTVMNILLEILSEDDDGKFI